jgi:hypothetical protein
MKQSNDGWRGSGDGQIRLVGHKQALCEVLQTLKAESVAGLHISISSSSKSTAVTHARKLGSLESVVGRMVEGTCDHLQYLE